VDFGEPQEPSSKSESAGEPFADTPRHIVQLSKFTTAPRSPDEAGPSGSSPSSPATRPAGTEKIPLLSPRLISFSPPNLTITSRPPMTATRPHSCDLTKLIPCTSANKSVRKYENKLNRLLEELDRVDSYGDAEVREKRKEVVKAVEKALEGVGHSPSKTLPSLLAPLPISAPSQPPLNPTPKPPRR